MTDPWDSSPYTLEEDLLLVAGALGLTTASRLLGMPKRSVQMKILYGTSFPSRSRAPLAEIAWHMRQRKTREEQRAWLWEGPPGNSNWQVLVRRANDGPLINPSIWQIWAMDAEQERALERPFEEIWENEGGASFAW